MSDSAVRFPAPGRTERRELAFDSAVLAGYSWPYFAISGAADGPTLCLLAGVHGAEYPPIDALIRFCRELDPATVRGRIVALPVVNLPAFRARTPFICPLDGKNPNRVFPGSAEGTFSEVLAHHIFEALIRPADALVDLHCGDLVEDLAPFSLVQQSGNPRLDTRAMDLAAAYGLPYLAVQEPSGEALGGTTNGAAAAIGIPAAIVEVGGVGQLQPEAVAMHLQGLRGALQHLEMLPGPRVQLPQPQVLRRFTWVRAARGGFFRKAVSAGDLVQEGTVLGEMIDLWGDPVGQSTSPVAGVVLFVTTSPAIGDDGLIAGIGAAT